MEHTSDQTHLVLCSHIICGLLTDTWSLAWIFCILFGCWEIECVMEIFRKEDANSHNIFFQIWRHRIDFYWSFLTSASAIRSSLCRLKLALWTVQENPLCKDSSHEWHASSVNEVPSQHFHVLSGEWGAACLWPPWPSAWANCRWCSTLVTLWGDLWGSYNGWREERELWSVKKLWVSCTEDELTQGYREIEGSGSIYGFYVMWKLVSKSTLESGSQWCRKASVGWSWQHGNGKG